MKNITIIGSGSFGCALAKIFSEKNNVKIWSYTEEETKSINDDHRCLFLPELVLDSRVRCFQSYEEALKDSEIVVLVTPSSVFKNTCLDIKKYINNQEIVIATKGFADDKLLSEIVKESLNSNINIISGPSHAEQISKSIPTYVDFYGNKELISDLETDNFKLTYNEDYIGIQLGAAIKNVISLGCGIIEGLGYGSNTVSYYITKGLEELSKIGVQLGAKKDTFYGLSGLGDLLTTSLSYDSRNKKAGFLLGQGKSIEEIKKEVGMTIESFETLKSIYDILQNKKINSDLINNLYEIIYKNKEINSILY